MKHKINASQTRKAELNAHPTALISNYSCKHFPFHNANKLILKIVRIRLLEISHFILFNLKITKRKCQDTIYILPMESVLQ